MTAVSFKGYGGHLKTSSQCLREGKAQLFNRPANHVAARRAFLAAIAIAPAWGEPSFWLGIIFEHQGKLQDAARAYERAIRLGSGARPMIALGWVNRLLGRYAAAVEWLEAGLILQEGYAEADTRLMLGECYQCLGQAERAAAQWRFVAGMPSAHPSYEQPMAHAGKKLSLLERNAASRSVAHAASAARSRARVRRPGRRDVRGWQVSGGS